MKKILSLAVLLMTVLVGFTACSDDEGENNIANGDFTRTTWKGMSDVIGAQYTCTVSFTSANEGVLKLDSKAVVAPGVEPVEATVFCEFNYTKNADAFMLNVTQVTNKTGEDVSNSANVFDVPFTYDAKTKTLQIKIKGCDYSLSEVSYHAINVPVRVPDNASNTPLDLQKIAGHWSIPPYCLEKCDMDINLDEKGAPKDISVLIQQVDFASGNWRNCVEANDRKFELDVNNLYVYDANGENIEYKINILYYDETGQRVTSHHIYVRVYKANDELVYNEHLYQPVK